MIIPTPEQMAIFGTHQMAWEYKTFDNEHLCYVIRHQQNGKKSFKPITLQNNEWVKKYFVDKEGETLKERPLYNLHLLKLYPEKSILLVEGEKTADAATEYFPEYNVLSWMGGAGKAKNVILRYLKNKTIYLLPDNDEPGYKAMELLKSRLEDSNKVYLINIKSLPLSNGWDLADLEEGEVDLADIKLLFDSAKNPLFNILSYPDLSEGDRPRPLDTTANLKYLLDHYNISVRWNMMKRIREVIVPDMNFYIEESENASLTYITNLAVTHSFNIRRIDKHLDAIAWEQIHHPVRDWLLSKTLKESLLNKFLSNIQTTNNELSYILIKRWMISAIATLFNDSNFCAQGVLVLEGEPGTHKSSFIMELVPNMLQAIKGGCSLDPSKKDDVFTLSEYWIVELGELDATFKKADIARLKSHITNDVDDVRRPHAVRNSKMIRRTIYAATVNEKRFLVDTTGNRRWWTISVTEPIKTRSNIDMQQVWREIYDLWLTGESPNLLENEMKMLNESNKDFEFIDPFIEKLDAYFDWDSHERSWMSSTQVLMNMGYDKPSKADCTRMGTILGKKNIPKGEGRLRRSYHMPRSRFDKLKTQI